MTPIILGYSKYMKIVHAWEVDGKKPTPKQRELLSRKASDLEQYAKRIRDVSECRDGK